VRLDLGTNGGTIIKKNVLGFARTGVVGVFGVASQVESAGKRGGGRGVGRKLADI